jgi:hypothetical protein
MHPMDSYILHKDYIPPPNMILKFSTLSASSPLAVFPPNAPLMIAVLRFWICRILSSIVSEI